MKGPVLQFKDRAFLFANLNSFVYVTPSEARGLVTLG